MSYLLSTCKYYGDMIRYENDNPIDYKRFLKGEEIHSDSAISYSVTKKSSLARLCSAPLVDSSGPELLSARLKAILDGSVGKVQFFEAEVRSGGQSVEGFFAINPIHRIDCLDMTKSEHKLLNFDPDSPEYMFYYAVVKDNVLEEANLDLVRCNEIPRYLAISERLKGVLVAKRIRGLRFYKSLDMTPNHRSVFEDT